MFQRVAAISLVLLALAASASAGFDWAAVTSKGSMQTGDVSVCFSIRKWAGEGERERERDAKERDQRPFLPKAAFFFDDAFDDPKVSPWASSSESQSDLTGLRRALFFVLRNFGAEIR
jgi:hypothetical protein